MSNFVLFNREQSFLLPPDVKDWLPPDDVAYFIVAAVDRVPLASFQGADRIGGKPQYHTLADHDEGQAGDRRWPQVLRETKTERRTGVRDHQKRDRLVRFHRRGRTNAASEWTLITLAYNCRRLNRPRAT